MSVTPPSTSTTHIMAPPPPIPHDTRPGASHPALPPNPAKLAGPPLVHLNPTALFALRDRITKDGPAWVVLRPLVKKVIQDPAVHTVTNSKKVGPGGRNAFLSYAPHFHPNKAALEEYLKSHPGATQDEWENRIPWDREDGNRTSDTGGATQSNELSAVCEKVFFLGLAWHFAQRFFPDGAEQYAKKAYELLWVFFGDPATAMLPEVEYGQFVRGSQDKAPYRPEGLLHVRPLIPLSQVLPLLPGPPSPYSPHHFMHPWLERHVSFLQNHEVGKMAAKRNNNIQTHYFCQLTTHLITLNQPLVAHSLVASLFFPSPSYPRGLSSKIDPNTGVMPLEVKRPKPFHYTCFELEPLVFLADLAREVERYNPPNGGPPLPDIWSAENHALKRAADFAITYFLKTNPLPKNVPKQPEQGADLRSLVFQIGSVVRRYGRGEYEWLVGKGGEKGMEVGEVELLKGWNQGGRLRWGLLEG